MTRTAALPNAGNQQNLVNGVPLGKQLRLSTWTVCIDEAGTDLGPPVYHLSLLDANENYNRDGVQGPCCAKSGACSLGPRRSRVAAIFAGYQDRHHSHADARSRTLGLAFELAATHPQAGVHSGRQEASDCSTGLNQDD